MAEQVALLGAGSWGTALAISLAGKGVDVHLWDRDVAQMQSIHTDRQNTRYMAGLDIPANVRAHTDLNHCLDAADNILLATPSSAFRSVLERISPRLSPDHWLAWASKGIEPGSGKLLHEIAAEVIPSISPACISGPTFAREVAQGQPTAITVAATDEAARQHWSTLIHSERLRAYSCPDLVGVEIGGACKNILAIAAGISDGLGFGSNSRSALITRGLQEIIRLGKARGGKTETFMGLAGLGDLVLTCTDNQSRNRSLGLAIAQGIPVAQAMQEIGQAVEGYKTALAVHQWSQQHGIEMPICEQTYRVLYEQLEPGRALEELLQRQQRSENTD